MKLALRFRRKNSLILLVCMGIAMTLWILNALGKSYPHVVAVDLNYVGLPPSRTPLNSLPEQAELEIYGRGWNLLREISRSRRSIEISLAGNDRAKVIVINDLKSSIVNDLPDGLSILSIWPRRLEVELGSRSSKKVPVRLIKKLTTPPSYGISGDIELTPDSIMVTGPSEVIDTLKNIPTLPLAFSNVSDSLSGQVNLETHGINLVLSAPSVRYRIPVEEFAEVVMRVPVLLDTANIEGAVPVLLNEDVEIRMELPITLYKRSRELGFSSRFKVYAAWDKAVDGTALAPLELRERPTYARKIRLRPWEVPFLLKPAV